jgi:hypothetical protein
MIGRPAVTVSVSILAAAAICLGGSPAGRAAMGSDGLAVTCSIERPTVGLGVAGVGLNAWALSPDGKSLQYRWTATAGRVEGQGAEGHWELAGLRPGTFAATVNVTDSTGAQSECMVRVVVRRDAEKRGLGSSVSRETARALLQPGSAEESGYGLYSYLLFGSTPSDAARELYVKTVESYLALVPDVMSLEEYVPRGELNILYLLVRSAPTQPAAVAWALDNYDYARARSLLRNIPRNNRDGPYILAATRPLGKAGSAELAAGHYLLQDLSSVPPHLAALWVKEFLNQAAQNRFWEEKTAVKLGLNLRRTIGIAGAGLPEIRKGLDSLITWIP